MSIMSTQRLTRADIVRFVFFAILLLYCLVMLASMTEGSEGLLPAILIPVITLLIVYRLVTIAFPGTAPRLRDAVKPVFDPSSIELLSADQFAEGDDEGALRVDFVDVVHISIWPAIAVALVYVLGHLVGGFLFALSFLIVYGDVRTWVSLLVAVLVTAAIWLLAETLNLVIWAGYWTRIAELL